jgi:IS30 family transposase
MTYRHLSQEERYQIYILMKDGKTQTQIAQLMGRHKSTISRELARNAGLRGYRPKQACLLAEERSLGSRNATQITATDWGKAVEPRPNCQSGRY